MLACQPGGVRGMDVAYLCAHKSATVRIDMLEDEVALETQIQNALHSLTNGEAMCTPSIRSFIVLRLAPHSVISHFCPVIFYPPFHTPSALSYLSPLYLSATLQSSPTCLHMSLSLAYDPPIH